MLLISTKNIFSRNTDFYAKKNIYSYASKANIPNGKNCEKMYTKEEYTFTCILPLLCHIEEQFVSLLVLRI